MSAVAQLGNVRRVALLVALVWSVALPIAGFTFPMYSVEVASSSGTITHGSDTLVGVNGPQVVMILLVPLLVSVVVTAALLMRRIRGAIVLAWTMTAALVGLTALALLSIGIFVLPVPVALLIACAAEPAQSRSAAPR